MSNTSVAKHVFYNEPLPPKWELKTVDNIKSIEKYACTVGPFGSNISSKFFVEEGVPVIRGGNLSLGQEKFITDGFVFISEDKAKTFPGQHVKSGDLVFTCWGTLGQVGLIPKNGPFDEYIISNKQLKLRPNPKICNSFYLYNYFSLPQMVRHINDIAIGSAVPGINLGLLKGIKVALPPKNQQDKIAAILSAYDDLIENNKRRIALLEKIAEEIYLEWFVRFRFPGWGNAEFEKGIPVGWELLPFSSLVSINPTERPLQGESKPYVGMEALSTSSMFFEPSESRITNAGSKFRNGDTLFPRITPCLENGKRGFVSCLENNQVAIGSTEFIVMREKRLSRELIYLICSFEPFRTHAEISMVGASGRQRVSEKCFSFYLIPMPPEDIIEQFTAIVRPMFDQIKALSLESKLLEKTKSQLLPRLISGKLPVEDLDIQLPPSMQANNTEPEVA